jgi:hypothetical protein
MTIPNDWHDATPGSEWRLDEERERASIKFTTAHGEIWWNGNLKSDASIAYSGKALRECGWNGDQNSRELSTATVRIKVEDEKGSDGVVRQVVKAISAKKAKAPKDPIKAQSLMAKLAGSAPAPVVSSGGGFATEDEPDYGYGG